MPAYESLVFSDEFLESLLDGGFSCAEQRRFLRALRLLDTNERHQSLRVHQLQGDKAGVGSASDSLRMTFERLPHGRKRMGICSRHYDR